MWATNFPRHTHKLYSVCTHVRKRKSLAMWLGLLRRSTYPPLTLTLCGNKNREKRRLVPQLVGPASPQEAFY